MREFLEYVTRAIVERPDEIEIREVQKSGTSRAFELKVAPDDRGRVIGKRGKTAHALRAVLAAANTQELPVNLEIVDS